MAFLLLQKVIKFDCGSTSTHCPNLTSTEWQWWHDILLKNIYCSVDHLLYLAFTKIIYHLTPYFFYNSFHILRRVHTTNGGVVANSFIGGTLLAA